MSWLDQIQLRDLDAGVRFELTCRQCGKARFLTVAQIMALCRQRGCGGTMRMVIPRKASGQGFVGGIA